MTTALGMTTKIVEKTVETEALSGLSLEKRRKSLKAAAVGNVLEWYDWTIYGTLTTYLAANFFRKRIQHLRFYLRWLFSQAVSLQDRLAVSFLVV